MRKIYILMAAAMAALSANAQNEVYFEDFEDNSLNGFTLYNLDGLTPDDPDLSNMADSAWTIKTIASQGWTYNRSAFSVSWYEGDEGPSNDWLVTPGINIGGEAVLEWDGMAITSSGSFRDRYQVFISTSSDLAVIETDADLIFDTGAIGEEVVPTHHTIDLAALGYENMTVYISFRNTTQGYDSSLPDGNGNGGNELAIDNIEVIDNGVVSTENVALFRQLLLLPNPSNGSGLRLNFTLEKATLTFVDVIDITGKAIRTDNLGILAGGAHSEAIKLEGLAKGVYMVRLRSSDSTNVIRAVIN